MIHRIKTTLAISIVLFAAACNNSQKTNYVAVATTENTATTGQSAVKDDVSEKNVVQIAISSKDHSTLVTAVKAAELVDALSNAGPFTVFAPTNAAFDKLPLGTIEGLLKSEKKDELTTILQYHVSLGVFKPEMFQDGQTIGQVDGGNIIINKKADAIYVNGNSKIITSIQAANGIVHVIDGVLLPPGN